MKKKDLLSFLDIRYRLIRTTAFVLIVLTLIAVVWTFKTRRELQGSYEAQMVKQYQQVEEYLNGVERMVSTTYYQFATDFTIEEWVQDAYRPTVDYYAMYTTHRRMLNSVNSNGLLASVYLYTYGNNRVLSTPFMFSELEQFPHKKIFEDSIGEKCGWMPAVWERPSGADAIRIIPYSMPITLNIPNGQIIINLDEQQMMRGLPENQRHILLVDDQGTVLFAGEEKLRQLYQDNREKIDVSGSHRENSTYKVRIGGYYAITAPPRSGHWQPILFIEAEPIAQKVREEIRGWVILCLGAAFLVGASCCVLVVLGVREKEKLRQAAEAAQNSRDLQRNELLTGLLTGMTPIQQFEGNADETDRNVFSAPYRVMTFEMNDYYRFLTSGIQENRLENGLIISSLRGMFDEIQRSKEAEDLERILLIKIGMDKFSAVLPETFFTQHIVKSWPKVQQKMEEEGRYTVCAAVSETACGAENAHASYLQTIKALSFKPFFRREDIIGFGQIKNFAVEVADYPLEDLNQVALNIAQGNIEAVEEGLNRIIQKLLADCKFSIDLINAAFANILYSMVKFAADSGEDTRVLYGGDIFLKMYACDEISQKVDMMKELCLKAAEIRKRSRSNPDNLLMQRIDIFIHENFDKEISLSILADELGMNISYISTLVKREFGVNFSDYVNELRIKKAVTLLRSTEYTVREVASNCGYDDVHTFIRNFKKQCGTTPAEYRKRYSVGISSGVPEA